MRRPAFALSAGAPPAKRRTPAGPAGVGLVVALAGLVGLAGPSSARADDAAAAAPAVVLRMQSVNDLVSNVNAIAAQIGQAEKGRQMAGIVRALVGPRGKSGVDGSKPFGGYVALDPEMVEHAAVLLIPVANQKAFLAQLEDAKIKNPADKADDGVYALNIDLQSFQLPAYLKFSKGYACVALRESSALGKKLLDPDTVLGGDKASFASLVVRIDAIPEVMRNTAVSFLQDQFLKEKDKREPNATDVQHKAKGQLLDQMFAAVQAVMSDGSELKLNFQFDKAGNDLSADLSLAGKSGSGLAQTFSAVAGKNSLFAGLAAGSAMSAVGHGALPEPVRAALEPVLDEGFQTALAKESDETKRKTGEMVMKALSPTLKSGAFDGGMALRGPSSDGKYTLVVGTALVKGMGVEQAFRDLVKSAPAEDQAKIKLDAAEAGGHKIHEIQPKDLPPDFLKTFGDGPIYVTFTPHAAIMAFGHDADAAIKQSAGAKPETAPALSLDVSVAKLIPLVKEYQAEAKKAAATLSTEKGNDRIRVMVRGGESMSVRVSVKTGVIQYAAEFERLKKAGASDDK